MNTYESWEEAVQYLTWYFENDGGTADENAIAAFNYIKEKIPYLIEYDGKHCGNCDAKIKYDYKFCPYCGRVIK